MSGAGPGRGRRQADNGTTALQAIPRRRAEAFITKRAIVRVARGTESPGR